MNWANLLTEQPARQQRIAAWQRGKQHEMNHEMTQINRMAGCRAHDCARVAAISDHGHGDVTALILSWLVEGIRLRSVMVTQGFGDQDVMEVHNQAAAQATQQTAHTSQKRPDCTVSRQTKHQQ